MIRKRNLRSRVSRGNSNKRLYESIMRDVAKTVKRYLININESKQSVIKLIKQYIKTCSDIDLLQSFVDRTLTQDDINKFTSYCYYENEPEYTKNLVSDQFLYDNFDDLVNKQLNKILNITNNRTSNYNKGVRLLVNWFIKYIRKSDDIAQTIDDWRYDRDILEGSSIVCQRDLKKIIRGLENDLDIEDIDNILKDIEHLIVPGDDDKSISNVRDYFNI